MRKIKRFINNDTLWGNKNALDNRTCTQPDNRSHLNDRFMAIIKTVAQGIKRLIWRP